MDIKEFKKKWEPALKQEIKDYDDLDEHDLDFDIVYKDAAYKYYKEILKDLKYLKGIGDCTTCGGSVFRQYMLPSGHVQCGKCYRKQKKRVR